MSVKLSVLLLFKLVFLCYHICSQIFSLTSDVFLCFHFFFFIIQPGRRVGGGIITVSVITAPHCINHRAATARAQHSCRALRTPQRNENVSAARGKCIHTALLNTTKTTKVANVLIKLLTEGWKYLILLVQLQDNYLSIYDISSLYDFNLWFSTILRYWKSLQNLLGSLVNSIEAIISLLVLLFLFLGIFALLGTQVFGGKFKERKFAGKGFMKPRANFDTFSESFYAVFQVTWPDGKTWTL